MCCHKVTLTSLQFPHAITVKTSFNRRIVRYWANIVYNQIIDVEDYVENNEMDKEAIGMILSYWIHLQRKDLYNLLHDLVENML